MRLFIRLSYLSFLSPLCVLALLSTMAGCASADLAAEADGDDDWEDADTPVPSYEGDDDSDNGSGWTTPDPPAENEDAFYRAAPAATDRFVFVVNPDRDTVTKIEANSRAVYTVPVDARPTQVLVGSQNPNKAVVLNDGSATLSILDVTDDSIETVDIHTDTNYMELSSDGQYAITYYNPNVENADEDINGVRSYSSISVVFTGSESEPPTSTPMAVALNPHSVTYIPLTDEALVLCDDALAVVSLSPEPSSRLIQLTDDIDEELKVSELKVGPDGHYAFLRLSVIPQLMVVDLQAEESEDQVQRIDLDGVPTDLDLLEDSLLVVDRANRELLVFDALDPSLDPAVIETPGNQLVGSVVVAPELNQAILYTTLTEEELEGTSEEGMPLNRFSTWDLETDTITLHELVKSVESVTLNHNSDVEVATFVHHGAASSDVEAFDGQESFSHFYFQDSLVVPSVLEAPIKSLADSRDGAHEFMILEDNLNVVVIDFDTRQVAAAEVQSQPAFVGILTGTDTAYVSQEHDLGRISFIDPGSLEVSTITGFELNSQY